MSTMLEQAVIDAAALKEAAVKNAESMILEKYAEEIRKSVDSIIFEEEEGEEGLSLSVGDEESEEEDPLAKDLPMAATDGEEACSCPEEDEEIEIDFDELAKAMEDEEEDLNSLANSSLEEHNNVQTVEVPPDLASDLHMYHYGMEDPIYKVGSLALVGNPVPVEMLEEAIQNLEEFYNKVGDDEKANLGEIISQLQEILNQSGVSSDEEGVDGLESIPEEVIDQMLESLEVDYENVPNGWDVGATESQKKEAVEATLATLQDDEVGQETEELEKALSQISVLKEKLRLSREKNKKLIEQNKSLSASYNNIKSLARKVSEKLNEMNISNAKLYYQNRVLKSDSLNEQQKRRLVEAVSKVDSVEKAKIAFETFQEYLNEQKNPVNRDETINEVVGRSRGSVLNLNNQQRKVEDPWKRRNQILAGIKK